MKTVGIYIGADDDDTENIVPVLETWIESLSDSHQLQLFGSAGLPNIDLKSAEYVSLTPRSTANPFIKIYNAYKHTTEYLKQEDPDIVLQLWKYNTHAPGLALASVQSQIHFGIRFTGDSFAEYKPETGFRKIGIFALLNILGRIPLRVADALIVFGPYGRSQVTQRGALEENIGILPPTLAFSDFPPEQSPTKPPEISTNQDRLTCLFVGRISERKGAQFLSRVIELVSDEVDIEFILIGDGDQSSEIRQRFPDELVKQPGYVPHDQIHRYYYHSDIYLHPSAYEGVPLVILEALACNCRVIARSAGDIQVAVEDTVTTPSEMANAIISGRGSGELAKPDLFTPAYQREALNELLDLE